MSSAWLVGWWRAVYLLGPGEEDYFCGCLPPSRIIAVVGLPEKVRLERDPLDFRSLPVSERKILKKGPFLCSPATY